MKFASDDFILYETFKAVYEPGRVISVSEIITKTVKGLGVRVSRDSTKRFLFQMQEQGYGKVAILKPQDGYKRTTEDYGFFCK